MDIILASKSPRRKELLKLIFDEFTIKTANADEKTEYTHPEKIVCDLARKKALALGGENINNSLVISADTLVFLDGKPLGKPANESDAKRMLRLLSGRTHEVLTGFCLRKNDKLFTDFDKTLVTFSEISEKEIDDYIKTKDPMDKAGSYGIQGPASKFIRKIDGCYFNVVGLPVNKLYYKIKELFPEYLD